MPEETRSLCLPAALAAGLLALTLAGCAGAAVRSADRAGEEVRLEKQAEMEVARRHAASATATAASAAAADAPAVPIPSLLGLADAIRIATAHNRDFRSRREEVFLSSLGLGLTRRDFLQPIISGAVGYEVSGGRGLETVNAATADLGARQLLPTGARLEVGASGALTHRDQPGSDRGAQAGASVAITQPLLRGIAPYAFETLTQAERDALYLAREFELFRQDFAVDVVERFYGLVRQKQRVANARRSTEALEWVARRAAAFFAVDRLNKIEKLRADQAYLRSRSSLIDEEQGLKLALDRFKIFLGVPTGADFDIPENATPTFVPVPLDFEQATALALRNRLDLVTARERVEDAERRVARARNGLLPDLSLTGSYSIAADPDAPGGRTSYSTDSYSAGVQMELPLDRRPERNAYRSALIDLERARRSLSQAEDSLVLEVRDTLRRLRQQQQEIEIQREIIVTEDARVRYAEIQYQAGDIGTRDLTEARESLRDAENALIEGIVAYEVGRLTLLRQVGILTVTREGRIAGR